MWVIVRIINIVIVSTEHVEKCQPTHHKWAVELTMRLSIYLSRENFTKFYNSACTFFGESSPDFSESDARGQGPEFPLHARARHGFQSERLVRSY